MKAIKELYELNIISKSMNLIEKSMGLRDRDTSEYLINEVR